MVVNGPSGSLLTNNPGSLKPDSRDPETETRSLEIEKRVHRIHGTLETGLHMIPRSLVAPSRGAGGFIGGALFVGGCGASLPAASAW